METIVFPELLAAGKGIRGMQSHIDEKHVAPYSVLATVYDQMMNHVNYPQWGRYLLRVIQKTGIAIGRILDIGCGTGRMVEALHEQGYAIDGCDPSVSMIRMGQRRQPQLHFYQDALPHLPHTPAGKYNVMLSLFDTMNYLPDINTLRVALHTIYHKLATPGVLVFDVVSPRMCETHFNQVVEKEVLNDKFAYERYSYFDRRTLTQTNEIKLFTPDGIFVETHVQHIFPFHEIMELIRTSSPFRLFNAYEEFTFHPLNDNSLRGHFVLVKGLGDD